MVKLKRWFDDKLLRKLGLCVLFIKKGGKHGVVKECVFEVWFLGVISVKKSIMLVSNCIFKLKVWKQIYVLNKVCVRLKRSCIFYTVYFYFAIF